MAMLRLYLRSSPNPHCFTGYTVAFFSSLAHARSFTTVQNPSSPIPKTPFIYDFLIRSLSFPKPLALSISNRFSHSKNPDNPKSVVQLLKQLDISDAHIRYLSRSLPRILFADVENSLKPKLQFFQQELGLSGSDLGNFISKNPTLLTRSLDKTLKPRIGTLKKFFAGGDFKNQDLVLVLQRCYLISESRFFPNVSYLKSCGIVWSRLMKLLIRQPRLFGKHESALREIVSRVLGMGFSIHSRTFVHAIHVVSCLSNETFARKLQFFRSLGFSKDEFMQIFRRLPPVICSSEENLKLKIDFYRSVLKFDNKVLVDRPAYFTYSLEDRVIPRHKVLKFVKSKGLFKKEPKFFYVLTLTEKEFSKFMLKFGDDAQELCVLYKGHLLESSAK